VLSDKQAFIDWAIAEGADVNTIKDRKVRGVPLIYAVDENKPALVKQLLDAGANPDLENFLGKTAKDYAEDPAILQMLEAASKSGAEADSLR
jgi:hypothetical protein